MNIKHLLLTACLVIPLHIASAQVQAMTSAAADGRITGKVVETMNAASYTYVLADTGKEKVWAASTRFAVKVGDTVSFSADAPMEKFHSKSLNRDFDLIYFTGSISVNGSSDASPVLPPGHPPTTSAAPQALPPGHPSLDGQSAGPAPDLTLTGIKPAAGGQTVQQIFAGSAKLAGQTVIVRGKVVKYNAMILGKNWLHIQDGSGTADKGDNDLMVTTGTDAKLGDTVLVTGILATNKDFGSGYKYKLMIDGAQVTVE